MKILRDICAFIVLITVLSAIFIVNTFAMPETDESEDESLIWHTIPLTKGAFAREMLGPQGRALFYVDGGPGSATRSTYLQFDLSDYLNGTYGDISIEELRLKLNVSERPFANDIGVYVLPMELSDFEPSILDGAAVHAINSITGTSMLDDASNLAVKIPHAPNEPTLTDDMWPAIKKHFSQNPNLSSKSFTLRLSEIKDPPADARATLVFTGATGNDNQPILRIGFKNEGIKRIDEAIEKLSFSQLSNENIKNVTRNLNLPVIMQNGVSVAWSSDSYDVIDPKSGQVTRPDFGEADKAVILTAKFSYGEYSNEVDYSIRVLADRNDSSVRGSRLLLNEAKETDKLKLDLSEYNSKLNDLASVFLRLVPYYDSEIEGNKSVSISVNGENIASSDYKGQLFYSENLLPAIKKDTVKGNEITLNISSDFSFYGSSAESDDLKPCLIMVSYEDAINEAIDYLNPEKIYEGNISKVRFNLNLSTQGKYDTKITWNSDKPHIITSEGVVNRPSEDTAVILTVTASNAGGSLTKSIPVTVLGTSSDSAYFRELLDGISFSQTAVTDDFMLPVSIEMMKVIWVAENTAVTEVNGDNVKVNRLKSKDYSAKITAAISSDGVTESKDFHFTVIRHSGNDILLKKTITDESGSKANAVNGDLDTFWTVSADRAITINAGKIVSEFLMLYDGTETKGLQIQSSEDLVYWTDVYTSGTIYPDSAVYLTLDYPEYIKYVRFILPDGINNVRLLSGYSATSGHDIFDEIILPEEVDNSFPLPLSAGGQAVSWISENPEFIGISDYEAVVSRDLSDRKVTLIAWALIDGEMHSIDIPVLIKKIPVSSYNNVSEWSEEYMISLWEKGIITEFRPNDYLKGDEMSKMISSVFSVELDVGINISRQDAAVHIYQILKNRGTAFAESVTEAFSDDEKISDFARNEVYKLKDLGILIGDENGNFNPNENITRAEMSKLLFMAMELNKD